MPYSGPDDESLPSNVKGLPANLRSQWVKVWNSAYANCMSDSKGGGAGSESKCEGTAMQFANGVVKKARKEMGLSTTEEAVQPYVEMLTGRTQGGDEGGHDG